VSVFLLGARGAFWGLAFMEKDKRMKRMEAAVRCYCFDLVG
jgi:hypothetical protein